MALFYKLTVETLSRLNLLHSPHAGLAYDSCVEHVSLARSFVPSQQHVTLVCGLQEKVTHESYYNS